ncbi:nicotinate-nicotinamide nucleotide adenylyltransferase [Vibrio sp. Of7-15]|uniref:nicotinate-nicotinamide nucleotide adenylyltransferase n=1 Tax=Vibrio sp. Of7-15 TaxID=2724879 RepID=UPI001EF1C2E0|nr:nicotinate-nicotinamide nucleotide adenylyltransferase [Vibrio sp. Of7-15]MCG7496460.1 nicotinate-nicotinamide nucleotide adenylyltransferase [Vibrio sp. Of7-15]
MRKIAVFGSAFNPPSLGHKSVLQSLSHFDLVLIVPSIAHAWGKTMLNYEKRCEMVQLFINDVQLPNLELSTVEKDLFQPNESVTTYQVLKKTQENHPDADITFVLGPDNFVNFSKFFKAEHILSTWSVLACPEKIAIRSTDIRNALEQGAPISHLTTTSVARYLMENQLYR